MEHFFPLQHEALADDHARRLVVASGGAHIQIPVVPGILLVVEHGRLLVLGLLLEVQLLLLLGAVDV